MYVGQVSGWRACRPGHDVLCCADARSSQTDHDFAVRFAAIFVFVPTLNYS